MVVRVNNPRDWRRVEAGQSLRLEGGQRKLRIAVKAPDRCRVDMIDARTDQAVFLGAFDGEETFEVIVPGTVELIFSGPDEVWYETADGAVIGYEAWAESYTRPYDRQPRNLHLERILMKQQQAAARLARSQQQWMEEARAEMARLREKVEGNGSVAVGTSSEPVDNPPTPAAPAGNKRKAPADGPTDEAAGQGDGA